MGDIKHICAQLRGYKAAAKLIDSLTDIAQKDRPSGRVNRNSKAYCAGYFSGLVAANALMALGEYPELAENAAIIDKHTVEIDKRG